MKKANSFSLSRKRRGFTLIEVTVAVGLIALVVALVLVYQSKAESDLKILETVSAITNLTAKIKSYHASAGNYSGLTSQRVHTMGLVVPPLSWDGVYIHDASGHAISVWGNAAGAAPTFVITIGKTTSPIPSNIPMTSGECASLASKLVNGADLINVGSWMEITDTNGLAGGGKVYKAAGNVLSMANLTSVVGCGAVNPAIVLQYH